MRWLLSALILLAGGAALWVLTPRRGADQDANVRLVDTRGGLEDVLRERAGAARAGEAPGQRGRLVRLPVDEELARRFHPALEDTNRNVYDPHAYYVPRPGFRAEHRFREHPRGVYDIEVDSRGFRRPGEIARERPDLRILVVGDSHVEGVMPVEETLTAILEEKLRARSPEKTIEVLNASRGGYAFYNYLGVLERNLDLSPHVFVMVVFGGNDFAGFLPMHLYFQGRELPPAGPGWDHAMQLAPRVYGQGFAQEYHQVAYFARSREAGALARDGSIEVVLEAARICEEHGIRFVLAYLPPVSDVERERVREGLEKLEEILELSEEDLESTNLLADALLARAAARGIETLDLRPVLRSSPGPHFYLNDHHLNPGGHAAVAQALYEHLAAGP